MFQNKAIYITEKLSPSYNNSRCVYIYIFPVPRIVATALNI